MRWPDAAAQIALLAAAGPVTRLAGQGLGAAYGAAKPVVQGVARRVGGAMKSAPFDPVRRKVLQGIGAGTAALATAGTGLFQGLGGPTATKAVTKAATPLLNKYNAIMKDPWFAPERWSVTPGHLGLRLKNGQPMPEAMVGEVENATRLLLKKGLSIQGSRNMQQLLSKLDAPSQAFFRSLGY